MWLSAMGLTLGLLMITAILALIVVKGAVIFWPQRVALIEIAGPQTAASDRLAGEVRKVQKKLDRVVGQETADDGTDREWQIYTANKDAGGATFRFVDAASIREVSHPDEIMVIERTEYGRAIGFPEGLEMADGSTVRFGEAGFEESLQALTHEAEKRRQLIRRIEKGQIGK
ncbi:MAG: hypothetical protein HQL11_04570, partial [Candidatus Omnitrophica bacterium]|nr:hypothetical protein [Candidatus Omnitrophota bacterium]